MPPLTPPKRGVMEISLPTMRTPHRPSTTDLAMTARPPVPESAVLVRALVHLHLMPVVVRRVQRQPGFGRASVDPRQVEGRQDARHFIGIRQPVIDSRRVADGYHAAFVEVVRHVVRLHVTVDAKEAVLRIVLP